MAKLPKYLHVAMYCNSKPVAIKETISSLNRAASRTLLSGPAFHGLPKTMTIPLPQLLRFVIIKEQCVPKILKKKKKILTVEQ